MAGCSRIDLTLSEVLGCQVETNKALARRYFEEFLRQGDLSVADEMFGPDVAFREATSWLHCMLLFIPPILMSILLSSCLAMSQPRMGAGSPGFYLSAPELLELSRALGSPDASDGTWERIITVGYQAPGLEPNG